MSVQGETISTAAKFSDQTEYHFRNMALLTLLVCSMLVVSSYSQPWWPPFGNGYGGRPGGNGGGNSGGHGGGNSGGNSGGNGGYGGGNSGGGSNTAARCSCDLNCVDAKANGNTAKCQAGYTAVSCSCGMGCGSYNFQGSNTCYCQCSNIDWTSARCCKNI
ncbi:resistin isoform X1 [Rhinoderma darwinii]|uniref:resistin isoform X1 n=1 Tax=Rhinoderma darwinii TaxID=43563 RepID=UPI003F662FA2